MTKKNFEAIARIIADREVNDHLIAQREREAIANDLADYFATVNPNFDLAKFLTACGL